MDDAVPAPLISAGQIDERVGELAAEISSDYSGRTPLVVVVLDGALVFAADIVRRIPGNLVLDTIGIRSYDGTETTGQPRVTKRLGHPVNGRDVIVVEDILDTGGTLSYLVEYLGAQGASSVALCVLLDKPSRRVVAVDPRYVGFQIADRFVVGYGLDFRGLYRNLPYIASLD